MAPGPEMGVLSYLPIEASALYSSIRGWGVRWRPPVYLVRASDAAPPPPTPPPEDPPLQPTSPVQSAASAATMEDLIAATHQALRRSRRTLRHADEILRRDL